MTDKGFRIQTPYLSGVGTENKTSTEEGKRGKRRWKKRKEEKKKKGNNNSKCLIFKGQYSNSIMTWFTKFSTETSGGQKPPFSTDREERKKGKKKGDTNGYSVEKKFNVMQPPRSIICGCILGRSLIAAAAGLTGHLLVVWLVV